MERILNELVDRLTKAYDDRLVSVVLYGSAAVGRSSRTVLRHQCSLRAEAGDAARAGRIGEPVFRWWREQGNPSPLLLSQDEVARLHRLLPHRVSRHPKERTARAAGRGRGGGPGDRRRLLPGAGGARAARQASAAAPEGRGRAVGRRTCCCGCWPDSVSTFCVLFRHALRAGRSGSRLREAPGD